VNEQLAYSPVEAARLLGVNRETIHRWLASGVIPGKKVVQPGKKGGGLWLVSAEGLRDWLASGNEVGRGLGRHWMRHLEVDHDRNDDAPSRDEDDRHEGAAQELGRRS